MAENRAPQAKNGPAAKTRSPIERVLVWGLIGALAIAAGIEYLSKMSHQKALTTLAQKIREVDEDQSKPDVTEADVKQVLGDRAPVKTEKYKNGEKQLEVYSWFTLNPMRKREIWVQYGAKGKDANELATVIVVNSSDDIAEPEAVASDTDNNADPMAGGSDAPMGPPMGMMGGARGGRGRPGAGAPTQDADKPNAETADADMPDTKTTDDGKIDADKPDEDKPDAVKTDKTDAKTE